MEIKHFESPCRGGQNYVSPSVYIVELQTEGVLCASNRQYGSGIDDLTETDYNW